METLGFVLVSLVAALIGTLLMVVVGVLAVGVWWLYREQRVNTQEQKKIKDLIGKTWQMGDRQAAALEKELHADDLTGSLSRSRRPFAP